RESEGHVAREAVGTRCGARGGQGLLARAASPRPGAQRADLVRVPAQLPQLREPVVALAPAVRAAPRTAARAGPRSGAQLGPPARAARAVLRADRALLPGHAADAQVLRTGSPASTSAAS